jgi:hypothetical protein
VKNEIASLYTDKDLGEAKYFLGINLNLNGTLRLSKKYIENILERFIMTASKPVSYSMGPNKNMMEHKPRSKEDVNSIISVLCREAIGALLCLSIRTRPKISVAVVTLAKYAQEHHPLHWEGVKIILWYLQGIKKKALVLRNEEGTNPLYSPCTQMQTGELTRTSATVAHVSYVSLLQALFGGSLASRTPLQFQAAKQNTWR